MAEAKESETIHAHGYRPIGKWMDESGRKRVPLSESVAARLINEALAGGRRRISNSVIRVES